MSIRVRDSDSEGWLLDRGDSQLPFGLELEDRRVILTRRELSEGGEGLLLPSIDGYDTDMVLRIVLESS